MNQSRVLSLCSLHSVFSKTVPEAIKPIPRQSHNTICSFISTVNNQICHFFLCVFLFLCVCVSEHHIPWPDSSSWRFPPGNKSQSVPPFAGLEELGQLLLHCQGCSSAWPLEDFLLPFKQRHHKGLPKSEKHPYGPCGFHISKCLTHVFLCFPLGVPSTHPRKGCSRNQPRLTLCLCWCSGCQLRMKLGGPHLVGNRLMGFFG